jgi:hypothetical protein
MKYYTSLIVIGTLPIVDVVLLVQNHPGVHEEVSTVKTFFRWLCNNNNCRVSPENFVFLDPLFLTLAKLTRFIRMNRKTIHKLHANRNKDSKDSRSVDKTKKNNTFEV